MRHLSTFALSLFVTALSATWAGDAAAEAKDPNAGKILDPTIAMVWSTEKGSKYHTKDCKSAKVEVTYAKAMADEDTPCATCKPPVYDPATIVVFATESGKKYHLYNCKFAKKQTTLEAAVKDGLEPCAVCKAPALWKAPAKLAQPADAKEAKKDEGKPAEAKAAAAK